MSREAESSKSKQRKVGVEMEFGGLTLERICELIKPVIGGEIEQKGPYTAEISGSRVGQVKVELDARLFTEFKLRGIIQELPLAGENRELGELVEEALASEARRWVPFELVFDPLPFERIDELDAVTKALREEAQGTEASIYNAFGLHFNPELPQVDAETVLRYLRSFLILYESLKKWHNVNLTRKAVPFISSFPRAYVKRVLDPDYKPDAQQFITDYLDHNPTRNRPLDLLPVFAFMNEALVREKLPDEKINARPTLHYRLPDCRIDDPQWSISGQWKIYLKIEELAKNEEELAIRVRNAHALISHPVRERLRRFWRAIRRVFRVG